ncbi:MAG: amino acid permease [Spirochaetales bacterium]|uniref:Amino acid permease n=1 Tax=Candidatus Thalassospirochaeta sargassi TaxID=3119039 RepID=A0AAJ1MIB6_9SPIO|nr:amino acid permease [Spirochaetales bacterium]
MKKQLGFKEVFSISSGAMISSGLFVLPSLVFAEVGPAVIAAYFLAALFVIPAMFAKTELATAMPKSGGDYFYINRSFGPLFGTFAGFASWFSLSLKSAFALVGIGIFLEPLVPVYSPMMVKMLAVGFTLVFTVLNILSVKESSRVQVILVAAMLAILTAFIIGGAPRVDINNFTNFYTGDSFRNFITAIGMIFISYGGLTKIASVAEEIKDPAKTIPAGMFAAYSVVTVLYILVIFIVTGVLPPEVFEGSLRPISDAAEYVAGAPGFYILSAAAMLAFISTANAGLMASSRSPLAMSGDHLLPGFFSRMSIKRQTPWVSILVTSAFMIACILLLDMKTLVKVASTMKLILFALVCIAVILMRESRIVTYKPSFLTPFYPAVPIAGLVIYTALIFEMGRLPLIITGIFFVASFVWYFIYTRSRDRQESAIVKIVERITSSKIKSTELSDELREILRERDGIVEDRFDRIIKESEILDIDEDMNMDELFKLLAKKLSCHDGCSDDDILEMLYEREEDSTTVIHDGLAIPHIVTGGKNQFDIVVVRSKKGIMFRGSENPVNVVFALSGSKDERNFHLKALMAIAQIVQAPDFLTNWMKVKTVDDLRNLILMAERARKGAV